MRRDDKKQAPIPRHSRIEVLSETGQPKASYAKITLSVRKSVLKTATAGGGCATSLFDRVRSLASDKKYFRAGVSNAFTSSDGLAHKIATRIKAQLIGQG